MTYAELVEKARETYESEDTPHVVKAWLLANIIYPTDKSDDERIRKALKQGFSEYGNSFTTFGGIKVEDILAWLEKQGDTFTKKDIDDAYLKGISDAKNELEKQGEQTQLDYEHKVVEWLDCTLNADKVIEWLRVNSTLFGAKWCKTENIIEQFKKDFGLWQEKKK